MKRLLILLPILLLSAFTGCGKLPGKPEAPRTSSKDFWIDRCDIKYRGKVFPVTGTVEDMVGLLGPYDRFESAGSRYFWDSLGLQISAFQGIGQIRSVDLYFAREESDSEIGLRLSGRPEDKAELAQIYATYPHGFFKGELVLEGARIGPVIDFAKVNATRQAYLKSQSGPDARLIAIDRSWADTRYAYERTCEDGREFGFLFSLISSVPPFRLRSLSIDSDNVPDSLFMPATRMPAIGMPETPKPENP